MTTQNRSYANSLAGGLDAASSTGRCGGSIVKKTAPTDEQIVALAKVIWQEKGCPVDKDEEHLREAEAELRRVTMKAF